MATYIEIRELFNDSDLINKIATATIIYAESIIKNSPTAAQKSWAASVFSNPQEEAKKITMGVLASNKGATVVQIRSATDAQIQAKVDAIASVMVDALAGV